MALSIGWPLRPRRSLWSYYKVQCAISPLIRGNTTFYRPLPKPPFLIDIGPGPNLTEGFYNFDLLWRPGVDRCCDITRGLDLPPSSVSGVFSEHCLEHISPEAMVRLLAELHMAMIYGAWMRIAMPDLELYTRRYVSSIDSGKNQMPYANLAVAGHIVPATEINAAIRGHGRQFVYDFQLLSLMLNDAGFRNITLCGFRQGANPQLLKDTEQRRCESFYVEAQK